MWWFKQKKPVEKNFRGESFDEFCDRVFLDGHPVGRVNKRWLKKAIDYFENEDPDNLGYTKNGEHFQEDPDDEVYYGPDPTTWEKIKAFFKFRWIR